MIEKIYIRGTEMAKADDLLNKQETLVSGDNIKTINGTSVLGSGDITIETGLTKEDIDELNIPTKTSQLTNDSGFISLPKLIARMEFDFSNAGSYTGVQPYFEYVSSNVYYDTNYITNRDGMWYIEEEGLYQFNISYYNDITTNPNVHFGVTTELMLDEEDNTKGLSTFNMGYCKEYDTHSFILKVKAGNAFYPEFDNDTGSGGPIGVATLIKLT